MRGAKSEDSEVDSRAQWLVGGFEREEEKCSESGQNEGWKMYDDANWGILLDVAAWRENNPGQEGSEFYDGGWN